MLSGNSAPNINSASSQLSSFLWKFTEHSWDADDYKQSEGILISFLGLLAVNNGEEWKKFTLKKVSEAIVMNYHWLILIFGFRIKIAIAYFNSIQHICGHIQVASYTQFW